LSDIAQEIVKDFPEATVKGHPAYGYLRAMLQLTDIEDCYGQDPASSVVSYFLSNAEDWKTEKSKGIKGYLQKLLDAYYQSRS